ncbi:MAG TPA: RNA polymerase sigma factor [Kineosporiaceae bacterium]
MEPGPQALLEQARAGNPEAFTALIQECDAGMRAVVYSLVRDQWLMDDILQQAYEKAFLRIGTFRGESSFRTWLHRICWTTAIDMVRAEGRLAHLPFEDDVVGGLEGPDPVSRTIARLTWDEAWGRLPAEQRAAVALVVGEGLNYVEAATVCGTTAGTIASRLSRARARLKVLLAEPRQDRVGNVSAIRPEPASPASTLITRAGIPGEGPTPRESLA